MERIVEASFALRRNRELAARLTSAHSTYLVTMKGPDGRRTSRNIQITLTLRWMPSDKMSPKWRKAMASALRVQSAGRDASFVLQRAHSPSRMNSTKRRVANPADGVG